MRHTIAFRPGPEDFLITTSGVASIEGFDAVVHALLGDARYLPGMLLLFDHRRLDWTRLEAEDLVRRLHIALKDADLIGPGRIALVASDPRLADVPPVRDYEPVWKAFTTLEDARAWLTIPPAA